MTNTELEILKGGVPQWNEWREKNPTVWPDLRGADLSKAKLDGVNLENTNLLQANLEGAALSDAKLRNANLKEANLRRAVLTRADLQDANLYQASLQEADMVRADLKHANLIKAESERTRYDFATFGQTAFDHGLIEGGIGLERIFHADTSIVDVRIFERADLFVQRKPEMHQAVRRFFKNAGVTERIIKAALDAISQALEWRSCFVSYSHIDKEFVERLCSSLEARGISCLRDEGGLDAGSHVFEGVASGIIYQDRTLLCCSWASLTSGWVEKEAEIALEREEKQRKSVIIPLDLDGCLFETQYRPDAPPLALKLRERVAADFRNWRDDGSFEMAVNRLAEKLRVTVGLLG
ncbi:MAG TPA: toll/interleukin-1 receptor domain-containing protein [Thermoanaerobaculia bacterium]|nr:toll/interleukin-1 receptor domain-containing protein [Thermoanaerobaculia bacterium]